MVPVASGAGNARRVGDSYHALVIPVMLWWFLGNFNGTCDDLVLPVLV